MGIITLTTDMGLKDHYVAVLKGSILSALPAVSIVDISHNVSPFNIAQAAYFLKSCIDNFPENTVHIVGVDGEPLIDFSRLESSVFPIVVRYKGQYFIGADNGFVGLLTDEDEPEKIWRMESILSQPLKMNFPEKDIYIPIAIKILSGIPMEDFSVEVENYRKLVTLKPAVNEDSIRGVVTYIDYYGNIITNISKKEFEHFDSKRSFEIYFRRKEYYISKISSGYNEVQDGEKVALFIDGYFQEAIVIK